MNSFSYGHNIHTAHWCVHTSISLSLAFSKPNFACFVLLVKLSHLAEAQVPVILSQSLVPPNFCSENAY